MLNICHCFKKKQYNKEESKIANQNKHTLKGLNTSPILDKYWL